MGKSFTLSTEQVVQWLLLALVVTVGIVILPFGANAFESSKFILLLLTLTIGVVAATTSFILRKNSAGPALTLHPLTLGLGGLAVATLISTLFGHSHPLAQLIGFGGTWLGFFGLILLGGTTLQKPSPLRLATVLGTTGAILSILFVAELLGLKISSLYNTLLGVSLSQGSGFSPIGSLFIMVQFCVFSCVACAVAMRQFPKNKVLFGTLLGINALGLGLGAWFTLPGKMATPVLLPWSASWAIGIDSLRDLKTAFVGVGPDSFVDAFTAFKPVWLNTTPWWNVEFTQGSTLSLSILSTHGLLGLFAWFFLSWTLIKHARSLWENAPLTTALSLAGLLLLWLVPPTTVLLIVWGVILAFLIAETKHLYPTWNEHSSAPPFVPLAIWRGSHALFHKVWPFPSQKELASKIGVSVVLVGASLALLFFNWFTLQAEFNLFRAGKETLKGNVVQLYENQKMAIATYPYNDTARRQYALTNLAIASAISNKTDVTEADGQQIAALVQQAIREAKASVLINPYRAQSWETLGDIYTNFIGIIDNSDALALEAYRQAAFYSPANPNLYIKLGGVFYRQGNYTDALVAFEQAARYKPDLANAYYNAANTLKELKQYDKATNAYKQTLLVLEQTSGASSEEYLKANLELEELQQVVTASASTELSE